MNAIPPKFGLGASALRLEDDALVTGTGRYADDNKADGLLHGYVLRSPLAKAKIRSVAADEAAAADGVRLVLTAADIAHLGKLASHAMQPQPDGSRAPTRDIPILCGDQVQYVGDAVAFVVADTRAQAQDAAELIEVDYEDEEPAVGTAEALEDGAPLAWPELGTNRAYVNEWGDRPATEAAFAAAAHVSRIEFVNNRLVCNYMEPRSATGEWREEEERFVLTTGSQGVHGIQAGLAGSVFRIAKEKLRVITGDVGGGFGTKAFVYREYALVLEAAKRLGRPVKWTSDRTEHFLTDSHGRDNVTTAEMAMDKDGRFLALRVRVIANMGAYIHQFGPIIPMFGSFMATGVYDIASMDYSVTGVYTNTTPVDAYRGAGRPEAAFMIESLVEACGRDLGLDSAEIRRRNFIRPDQFPYHTPSGRMYDVGEFEANMDVALERADRDGFDKRLAEAAARGRLRGFGMSTYIEACAFAGSEPAFLELNGDGTLTLLIGTQSNGQGHKTAYAQLVAEKLNVDITRIEVRQGDTDELPAGGGTGGSRSIPLGGVSAARAGEDLAKKIRKIAADELETSPEDIELVDGEAVIVGTDRRMDFASIARAAKSPDDLKGEGEFVQEEATYPTGTHICEVEIDPETGTTEIVAYTIVDDFGATVNPMLLEGQVHGGVVQGIGQALMENTVYGEDGQLISATFMDYAMPRADNMPSFGFETRNVPSTTNVLGIKGAGEAGTIGATPAAMNAVKDALWRAHRIRDIDMPATPVKIWQAIADAS
ncbi:MAG: xanthine dehydrogenase family protein molybdopterin-binding subunit [Rhizobiaceae bacterium]